MKRATDFEDEYIVGILRNASHDREIKAWADGVNGHYERKRRMEILENARVVIVGAEDGGTFMVEVKQVTRVVEPEVIAVQGVATKQDDDPADAWGWNDEETSPVDDDPWAEELSESTRPPKETYLVSGRTKDITRLIEDALHEGQEFASSQLFSSSSSSSSSPPGTVILRCALSIFDLYRALYPVVFGAHFALSSELALRFSNDCLYLSGEVGHMEYAVSSDSLLKQNFEDSKENLKVLGDSYFEDIIVSLRDRARSSDLE